MPDMNKTEACYYCENAGPEPGWIYMDNNGPIVSCPICNEGADWRKTRDYDAALAQRKKVKNT